MPMAIVSTARRVRGAVRRIVRVPTGQRSRRAVAGTMALAVAVTGGVFVYSLPWQPDNLPLLQDFGSPADGRDAMVVPRMENPYEDEELPGAEWPTGGDGRVSTRKWTHVGGLPIRTDGVDVDVEVLDRSASRQMNVSGVVIVIDADSAGSIDVGYESFSTAFGGGYGDRLTAVLLPDCEVVTSTCESRAENLPTMNDTETRTLSIDVEKGRQLIAVMAEEDSAQGTYTATTLSPSSSWSAGGSGGSFNWSYPIGVPSVPGGLQPTIALSYSSQTVDGQTAATNNQGSWIGTGFTYEPGYIERRYKPCSDDGHDRSGDQCWAYSNATIVLNDVSGDLVRDGDTWRISNDTGAKVEKLSGTVNADHSGEYWKVTTTDGTQYFFGLDRLPGWTDGQNTNSTWAVPVAGDDDGEPCHGATFEESFCDQAWRWNLDYVVNPHGNVAIYHYGTESNRYARNGDVEANGVSYTRGGYLKRIDYGLRTGSSFDAVAPARVEFTVAERCIPVGDVTCAVDDLTEATANDWPDVPFDRHCDAGSPCEPTQTSPSFWTRKRLVEIRTLVSVGTGHTPVDSWTLSHSWVSNGDLTRSLWLDSIIRKGLVGGEESLPAVELLPVQRQNRVDVIGDSIAPMWRPRVATIYTDTGGQIDVGYTDVDCTPGDTPAPKANDRLCYPVIWRPGSSAEDITDWFHKYLVTEVNQIDRVGETVPRSTRYEYHGAPAWRHAEPDGITDENDLTWSQWRGYGQVGVITAAGTTLETRTTHTYLRGLDGDDDGSGGTRSVTVVDSEGGTHVDHDELSGSQVEIANYDGDELVSKTITSYWRHVTATEEYSWGDRAAVFTGPSGDDVYTTTVEGVRRTRVTNTYDPEWGRITQTSNEGDLSTTADDTCQRNTYNDGEAAHLYTLISLQEQFASACADVTAATPLLTATRNEYDDGAEPTRGQLAATDVLAAISSGTPEWATTIRTTYDEFGRPRTVEDAHGAVTSTVYTDTNGLLTAQTTTNPLGHTVTRTYQPERGVVLTTTDQNGLATRSGYDALGRLTAVWLPDRNRGTWSPNYRFSYHVVADEAPAVLTESINADAVSYLGSWEIYDGWLRPRQTQTPGDAGSRVQADTVYDAAGRVAKVNAPYAALGDPGPQPSIVTDGETDGQTVTKYDAAGRVTDEIFQVSGAERWRTSYAYGGDRVSVTPPEGGTPSTTIMDAAGNVIELRQFHGPATEGAYDATTYSYTRRNELAGVVDAAGNTWSYEYDLRGRLITRDDPDTGVSTTVYDDMDRPISTTDAREETVSTVYDDLGRQVERYDGTPETGTLTASWLYDTWYKGWLSYSTSFDDGITYLTGVRTRDLMYRPLGTITQVSGDDAGALAGVYRYNTSYNVDGTVSSYVIPTVGGFVSGGFGYRYDELRRITYMDKYDRVLVDNVAHGPIGQLLRVGLPSGATDSWQSYEYEPGTQRLARTYTKHLNVTGNSSDIRYRYDEIGNVTSIIDSPSTVGSDVDAQCFAYDHLRRMTDAWTTSVADPNLCEAGPDVSGVGGVAAYRQQYAFDVTGNRTGHTAYATGVLGAPSSDTTYTYVYPNAGADQPHALREVTADSAEVDGRTAYTYDDAGNTTSIDRDGALDILTWDASGRLDEITHENETSRYFYDADGNRVFAIEPSGKTLFLPGIEAVEDANGTVSATRTIQLLGGVTYVETSSGSAQYQLSDHHGTATMSLDPATGQIVHRRTDPFGNPRGPQPADGTWFGRQGFVGGMIDLTGLTHLGAREYDPVTGRFISIDPLIDQFDPQTMHGYAYANNAPTTFSDPNGLAYDCAGSGSSSIVGCGGNASKTNKGPKQRDDGVWVKTTPSGTDLEWVPGEYYVVDGVDITALVVDPTTISTFAEIIALYEKELASLPCHTSPVGCPAWTPESIFDELITMAKIEFEQVIGSYEHFYEMELGLFDPGSVVDSALDSAGKYGKYKPKGRSKLPSRCNSFVPGTQVLMADGTTRPIEDVEIGDMVMATDPETGETAPMEVTATIDGLGLKQLVEITIDADGDGSGDATVTATDGHPFWIADLGMWAQAKDLTVGAWLRTSAGTWVQITAVTRYEEFSAAYNLTVDGYHTYYVVDGGVDLLAHNAGCEEWANDFAEKNGGTIYRFVGPGGEVRPMGPYRPGGKEVQETWFHHYVVIKDGLVYDQYHPKGLPVGEYKKLWDYGDDIDFGF